MVNLIQVLKFPGPEELSTNNTDNLKMAVPSKILYYADRWDLGHLQYSALVIQQSENYETLEAA